MENADSNGTSIDWTKYFDRIWCISFLPYAKRRDALKRELRRIGMSSHPNLQWNLTFDSPYFSMCKRVLDANPSLGRLLTDTELKCWAGHYSCIKRSVELGDDRVLIIEDDSRFLNDVGKIRGILENMPTDYDITMLDYFVCVSDTEFESYKKRRVNDYFSEFDRLNSTGCYALSHDALKKFEEMYEHTIIPTDNYIYHKSAGSLKKCFSLTNLSCQATYSSSMSFSNAGVNTIHRVYAKSNIIYSDYNMNDGKPYDYGDFIES